KPLTIKTPGKLMIAGEFAVLEPHHQLAVMAVDRFVYTTLEDHHDNRLTLENFNLNHVAWSFENGRVNVHTNDVRVRFVEEAMTIALTYLKESKISLDSFSLTVRSELDDESGKKYGLGSSAAVVTSVIYAILKKYMTTQPSTTLLFKLASIAHVNVQGNGSGADVAASAHGGVLQYASFQADWLQKQYHEAKSLSDVVEKEWTYFMDRPLKLPQNVHICIGWTGKPASTSQLVDKVLTLKQQEPATFDSFLSASKEGVTNFFKGMKEENLPLLFKGVKQNRQALATVGKHAKADLETPLLRKLCDLAVQYGGAGKQSGAGGGDCGIAFMPSEESVEQLKQAWIHAGIQPLDLKVSEDGTVLIE